MKSAPIPDNEQARLNELLAYQLLDTEEEADFNDIVKLASQICETPISLITLIDADRQWFKAKTGLDASETPRDLAFCAHAIQDQELMIVPDATKDERFANNPLVTGNPHVGFYAGMPLITENGFALGTLCVVDHQPRELNEMQLMSLRILSKQAVKLMELRLKVINLQKSEAELRQSEEQINLIFQHSIDAVVLINTEGFITLWNSKAESVFGWNAEEVIGKELSEIIIPERYRLAHKKGMRHYMETGEGPILRKTIEIQALTRLSKEIDIALEVSPIMLRGEKHFLAFINDITEQKLANSKLDSQKIFYETILDQLPTDIAVFDTQHRYLFVNPGAIKSAELRKYIIGKDDYEYCAYRNRDMSVADKRREQFLMVEQSRSPIEWEDTLINPEGKKITHLRKMFPVYNKENELQMMIGFGIDITERKVAEEELLKAKNLAEQLTGSKDQFLANMSHEIRTPMNAILGMSHQMGKTELDAKQKFYNDTISKAAENLLIIINDILDFSKIEAGKLSLENIGFDLSEVIDKAIQVMVYKAEEKGISIVKKMTDHRLAPVLIGDPYRINQVLLNLISNAIKFTEKGSVQIVCDLVKDHGVSQTIRISVIDTGIGMDKAFVDKIYEKFTQEDVSVTRRYGGTGLGVSISKELISLMGGEIKVESEKNEGTQISFELTLRKGNTSDLPVKEIANFNTLILSGKKILVVDDNEMNRVVATTVLSNYGAITLEALNGKESLDILHHDKIDLVLMDIQMPIMDGIEATKRIRQEISESLPVIALTANAMKGDNEKYFSVGMNDYISKPFAENDLIKMCAIWLGKQVNLDPNANPNTKNTTLLYDLTYLEEISRGDNDFLNKMVELFVTQMPVNMLQLNEAYEKQDMAALKSIAHKSKSSIDTLMINSLQSVIKEIEWLAIKHENGDHLKDLMMQMNQVIPEVIDQLKKII